MRGPLRLRYRDEELPLAPGDFKIGRARDCDLVIEDPLVSRHHALLRVGAEGVIVHDLGSANGVLLNGAPLAAAARFSPGDKLTLGEQDIYLVADEPTIDRGDITLQTNLPERTARRVITVQSEAVTPIPPVPVVTQQRNVFELLLSSAARALAEGDLAGAEGSAANMLVSVRAHLVRRQPLEAAVLEATSRMLLDLAERVRPRAWTERLFELHATAGTVLDVESGDRLIRLARRTGYAGGAALDQWLKRIDRRRAELSDPERRLVDRIRELVASLG
jgi:hypothetical protein